MFFLRLQPERSNPNAITTHHTLVNDFILLNNGVRVVFIARACAARMSLDEISFSPGWTLGGIIVILC